jgi:hypothetical protein
MIMSNHLNRDCESDDKAAGKGAGKGIAERFLVSG